MADDEGVVHNSFEFPNTYGLSETLESVAEICSGRNVSDYMAAKAEYQAKFTVDELFAAPPTGL